MSSRRALLKDGASIGHFDASMPLEECERIVASLNLVHALANFGPKNSWNTRKLAQNIMEGAP